MYMNKTDDDNELLKKALIIGSKYIRARGYGEIESHDSQKLKVEFIYKALVQDKL
ncbi:MAG: DUF5062 family protein, partial [Pseudomonadota bacterium]|nr:DUF5062 family protein [Pseudomonadota bacterium]